MELHTQPNGKLAQRLEWLLTILRDAQPAAVEPQDSDMGRSAHWAWSLGLAHRCITTSGGSMRITYSITDKGLAALDTTGGAS